jgi:uncharacterized glyoxalase superfamily protein PhnB
VPLGLVTVSSASPLLLGRNHQVLACSCQAAGTAVRLQIVVSDVAAARQSLVEHGVQASEIDVQPWGSFVTFADPDGSTWALQELRQRS